MPAHALLCQEGQITDRFFIVTSGEVEIAKSIAGKSCALSTTGPGSVLGLMPALDGGPCAVSMAYPERHHRRRSHAQQPVRPLDPEQASASNLVHDLALVAIRRLRAATDELAQTLFQSLRSSPRAGRLDPPRLARIQAANHAWPCVRLAA
jgi:CRP-like cAMP-binding protein